MRNPWGREEYNGPWSDKDTARWTAEAKNKLGHDLDKWDGTFWMRFSDFHRIFKSTMVGMYADWHRDYKRVEWDRTDAGIAKLSWNVKVSKKQWVVFGVQGPTERHFMNPDCDSRFQMENLIFYVNDSNGKEL
jgi:hypothetical protein